MEPLAELLSSEHGKTIADAKGDIQRGIEVIEFAIGIPHLLKGEFTEGAGTGIDVYSMRQPLGVVAGITPFNFPAMIPLWKAGPALACGNAFILKPSERDPSVPVRLAELFLEAGLPGGRVPGRARRQGGRRRHPAPIRDIKAVGFVGSTPIAQYIYATAAAHGKRAQCFGGAKNHMIVMPDADLDQAVDALIGAGYGSAGERCMAISVAVPVGEETADRLRGRLDRAGANSCASGHATTPEADYGPLVTEAALERVRDYIAHGVEEGAEAVVDGRGVKMRRATENGLLHRRRRCSTTSRRDMRSTPTRSSARCCPSCAPTTTKRRCGCPPSTSTATASRSSPATATPRATSCPASGRHGRRQRADPGAGRLPHLRRLEAVRLRRPQPARPGLDRVLHQDQDGHRSAGRPASRMAPNFVIPTMN